MPEPTAPDKPTHPESQDLLGARDVPFDAAFTIGARPRRSTRRLSELEVELHAAIAVTSGKLTIAYPTGRPGYPTGRPAYPTGRPDPYLHAVRVHRVDGARWRTISHHTFPGADRAAIFKAQQ
jgi:hypothetical protein